MSNTVASLPFDFAAAPRVSTRKFSSILAAWEERLRERWKLRELMRQPHLMADVGLSQTDVHAALGKPLWQR